jgi:hypothetical protein
VARIDSLRLLLAAEIPSDLVSIEAALRAIVERLDELAPGSPAYTAAHRRIDSLLTARDMQRDVDRVTRHGDPGGG